MFNGLIKQTNEIQVSSLLAKIGVSENSCRVLAPFLISLSAVYSGLISKSTPIEVSKNVYDLALFGFLASNEKVKEELDAITSDKEKLQAALKILAEDAIQNIMAEYASSSPNVIDPETGKKDMSLEAVIHIKPKLH